MNSFLKLSMLAVSALLSGAAQASLIDRGNGLIYDSDLNMTWLQNANLAQTSSYDADGRMTWADAKAWAAQLSFAGFNDWRLPALTDNAVCVGNACGNSELAHLFYGELGGQAEADLNSHHNAAFALFNNVQSSVYWLQDDLTIAPGVALAWGFVNGEGVLSGYQNLYNQSSQFHAWAVHAGDIGGELNSQPVPLPAAGWLFVAGLSALIGKRRR